MLPERREGMLRNTDNDAKDVRRIKDVTEAILSGNGKTASFFRDVLRSAVLLGFSKHLKDDKMKNVFWMGR